MKKILLSLVVLFCVSCATDADKAIEEAKFLLDQGKFSEALAVIKPVAQNNPNNDQAQFVYASALIGDAGLSARQGCPSTDTGYLGLLACLQDNPSGGQSDMDTFVRIAPDSISKNNQLVQATNLLANLNSGDISSQDIAFQRMISRLFEIAGVMTAIGANSANDVCNTTPANALKDSVPDDFDHTAPALTTTESERFSENLQKISNDAEAAGLGSSFALASRAASILGDVQTNIASQGGDSRLGLHVFFVSIFASASKLTCNQPK
ncbi:MAG: hypothetical protein R3A11_05830 [Bdellovibrionota bacterium]